MLQEAAGRKLEFLANVDPVDAVNALHGLNPETTLVVIVSKTFTTAETMLNARTARCECTCGGGEEGFVVIAYKGLSARMRWCQNHAIQWGMD